MKATITGLVLEKVVKVKDNKQKKYLRIYQSGNKENLDIRVTDKTFNEAKEGKDISITDAIVDIYNVDGRIGIYCMEDFRSQQTDIVPKKVV